MVNKVATAVLVLALTMLAFSWAFGQENAPWHISNCPTATNCCIVPVPQMTQPVPGARPTTVQQSSINLYGVHVSNENAAASYFQFFNSATQPAAGATPLGASSWFVPPAQDRDLVVGELRGMAFTAGAAVCCSSTQGTFTSVGGCGFLLQYY